MINETVIIRCKGEKHTREVTYFLHTKCIRVCAGHAEWLMSLGDCTVQLQTEDGLYKKNRIPWDVPYNKLVSQFPDLGIRVNFLPTPDHVELRTKDYGDAFTPGPDIKKPEPEVIFYQPPTPPESQIEQRRRAHEEAQKKVDTALEEVGRTAQNLAAAPAIKSPEARAKAEAFAQSVEGFKKTEEVTTDLKNKAASADIDAQVKEKQEKQQEEEAEEERKRQEQLRLVKEANDARTAAAEAEKSAREKSEIAADKQRVVDAENNAYARRAQAKKADDRAVATGKTLAEFLKGAEAKSNVKYVVKDTINKEIEAAKLDPLETSSVWLYLSSTFPGKGLLVWFQTRTAKFNHGRISRKVDKIAAIAEASARRTFDEVMAEKEQADRALASAEAELKNARNNVNPTPPPPPPTGGPPGQNYPGN